MQARSIPALFILASVILSASFGCKGGGGGDALLQLDVFGDQRYEGLTLRISAEGLAERSFGAVTFDAVSPFAAGLYVPAGSGAAVRIVATVDDGVCVRGRGELLVANLMAGQTLGPLPLTVKQTVSCEPIPAGTGGAVASGAGGATGAGGAATGAGGAATGAGGAATGAGGGAAGGTAGNLIVNGDFSAGETLWQVMVYTPAGSITHAAKNGGICLQMISNGGGSSGTLGWSADRSYNFALLNGATYDFSYTVSWSGPPSALSFEAKVGLGTNFDVRDDPVTDVPQTFHHTFRVTSPERSTGVAFNVVSTANTVFELCLDDVALVETGPSTGGTGGASGTGGAPAQRGNLIVNGDFSAGMSPWHVMAYTPAPSVTSAITDGALCLTMDGTLGLGNSATIGWPDATSSNIALVSGATYQFAYQAWWTGSGTGLTVEAKAGMGINFDTNADKLGNQPQAFQHDFTVVSGEPSTGVAFNVLYNGSAKVDVCVDNVTLIPRN
jgi:hypothetical protein